MNREAIIRMAREASNNCPDALLEDDNDLAMLYLDELERFAALVAAHENEACAKVCEDMRPSEREFDQRFFTACTLNANAIRARGQA